jgi:hypothetical protein
MVEIPATSAHIAAASHFHHGIAKSVVGIRAAVARCGHELGSCAPVCAGATPGLRFARHGRGEFVGETEPRVNKAATGRVKDRLDLELLGKARRRAQGGLDAK